MYLGATGMVCPIGLSAPAACAAFRAGIATFCYLPYSDQNRQPIVGAFVPSLDFKLKRGQRLVEMLSMALADCLGDEPTLPLQKIPLLVGLAEPGRPAGGAGLTDSIVSQVQERLGSQFHPRLSRGVPKGHTAGFEALSIARELLQDRNIPGCLICGVDSYINASSLLWLEHQWRLKREDHSNGVIPGEGAAAVYVQREAPANEKTTAQVIGLGFGQEKATISSTEPLLGLGLTAATKAALAEARLQLHDVDFRLSDVTGEAYGFKELSLVVARLHRVLKPEFPHWHFAESVGDTGAAAGVYQLIIALHAFRKGYAAGDRVICSSSAAPGDRAVALLERHAV
jgi:3-oxoacyl-[acyl-carrier-protein] synthase-1